MDTWPMSSANLDLVRSIFAAWERGDFSSVDWADPEIEFVVADGTSPGEWKGLAEMTASWLSVLNAYDDFRSVAEEYRELDDGRILVLLTFRGRGRASALEIADIAPRAANLLNVRDGKVTKLIIWWNRDLAFADLGLAPDTGSPDS